MTSLERQLYRDEGEVLSAYQDSKGYWTIGIGHLIDKRKGGKIPVEISRLLLAMDIKEKTQELTRRLPWTAHLDEVRFAALVNMSFQMGVDGLIGFKDMLMELRSGNWDEAERHALDSKWAREDTPERAQRVAKQLRTGEWQ